MCSKHAVKQLGAVYNCQPQTLLNVVLEMKIRILRKAAFKQNPFSLIEPGAII